MFHQKLDYDKMLHEVVAYLSPGPQSPKSLARRAMPPPT